MGFVYDLYGRKTPILIFLVLSVVAVALVPWVQTENQFYTVILLALPLNIIMGSPWVPDLITVESQGIAQAISSNVISLALITNQIAMLLNSENYYFFKSKYIYFGNSFMLAFTFFVVKRGMKDVVVERKQAALENT